MHKHTSAKGITFLILVMIIFSASVVPAHTIKLFATVENQTITGYGYFPGGGKYRNGTITVYGPENITLGQVTTDDKGAFSFAARYKCDHVFSVETSDGHGAQYTVTASELPDSLPQLPASKIAASQREVDQPVALITTLQSTIPAPQQDSLLNKTETAPSDLERMINSAIARHVRPLREQLEQYEQKVRLHDILGGVGYIFGIAGIALYYFNRKKSDKSD